MVYRGVDLRPAIDQLKAKGFGWEDICRALAIRDQATREWVRSYVVGK